MFKSIMVAPAYGRDYLNAEQAQKAWEDGSDFVVYGTNTYINNEDAKTAGFTEVRIRFRKRTKLVAVKVA